MPAPSYRLVHLDETASTNADAMRLALAGEALPLWVLADRQTAGRGRAGRTWVSAAGNLHTSVARTVMAPLERAGQLSLVAGIALIEAVRAADPLAERLPLRLKWPNDILIEAAKAGGILVETTTARGEPGFLAVLGFGVNLAAHPEIAGREVTALADHAIGVTARELLDCLAIQTERWFATWDNGDGFETVRNEWMRRAGPVGEAITVNTSQGPVTALYKGLAPSGGLLIETANGLETISYGDVQLVTQT